MDEKIFTVPPMEFMTDIPEKLLKAIEVAEILNISRAFAYRLMQHGKIRTVFIEGARRVRPEDLREYIEDCLSPPIYKTYSD